MKNWKTTLFGVIAVLPQLAVATGITLPVPMLNLITAVAGAIAFFFAKDKNVTGSS